MRTGTVCAKALSVVTAAVLMLAPAATAQEAVNSQLDELKHKLNVAQWKISGGDLENGLKQLSDIKQAAEQHLPAQFRFAQKVAEAVAAEKSGDAAKAEKGLREAAAMATDDDQFQITLRMGEGLIRRYLKNEETGKAKDLAVLLTSGAVNQAKAPGTHLRLVGVHLAIGDLEKAERALGKAADLAKTKGAWQAWSWRALALFNESEKREKGAAVYRRLARLAKSAEAKAAMFALFLRTARRHIASADADTAGTILALVKTDGSIPAKVRPSVRVVEQMLAAHARSAAGDHPGALAAMQDAYVSAKAAPAEVQDVYRLGSLLLRNLIRAKKGPEASKLVAFLQTGPGKGIEPLSLHMDLARSRRSLGQLDEAEAELRRAAAFCKTEADWNTWAGLVWSVSDRQASTDAGLAVFDAMAPLAKSKPAKVCLLGRFLTGARPQLGGTDVAKGLAILKTVEAPAADFPELTTPLALLRKMASVHSLLKADDPTDALKALKKACELVKHGKRESRDLYALGTLFIRDRIRVKDGASAQAAITVLNGGPAEHVAPRTRHMDIAGFQLTLGDLAGAERELSDLAGRKFREAPWGAWSTLAWLAIRRQESVEKSAEAASRLCRRVRDDEARKLVLQTLLARTRNHLSVGHTDRPIAVLDALRSMAARIPEVKPTLEVIDGIVVARTAAAGGDYAGALKALQEACQLAKGRPRELSDLYGAGRLIARKCLEAKDDAVARHVIDFLRGAPAESVDPFTLHTDLARIYTALKDATKAEKELVQAAPLARSEIQQKLWAGLVWRMADGLAEPEDAVAAYRRMAPLANSEVAREILVARFLTGARRHLASVYPLKGHVIFDALKDDAAAVGAPATRKKLLEHLARARSLSAKGDHAGALAELREACKLAGGDKRALADIVTAGGSIYRGAAVAKDATTAQAVVDFLSTTPGSELDALKIHGVSAERLASLRHFPEAEAELRKAAPFGKDEADWRRWAEHVLAVADRADPLSAGLALCGRLSEIAKSEAAKNALTLAKARLVVKRGSPADGEEQVRQLKAGPEDTAALKYHLASRYVKAGQVNDASRVFNEAEASAEPLTDATRDGLLRKVFYYHTRVRYGLPTLLAREVHDSKAQGVPDRVVRSYVEAAAAGGKGEEALKMLAEIKATPGHYLLLAKHLRNYGDVVRARTVLNAIPRSTLSADPELAQAVRGFWPSPGDRTNQEIARCQGLIRVYEGRAARAKADGNAAAARRFQNQIKLLKQKLSAFQKEAK